MNQEQHVAFKPEAFQVDERKKKKKKEKKREREREKREGSSKRNNAKKR